MEAKLNALTNGKVTSASIGALEVKLNAHFGKHDRLTDGPTNGKVTRAPIGSLEVKLNARLGNCYRLTEIENLKPCGRYMGFKKKKAGIMML